VSKVKAAFKQEIHKQINTLSGEMAAFKQEHDRSLLTAHVRIMELEEELLTAKSDAQILEGKLTVEREYGKNCFAQAEAFRKRYEECRGNLEDLRIKVQGRKYEEGNYTN
jgi:hypothetical protein